jgi:hypothetical protein
MKIIWRKPFVILLFLAITVLVLAVGSVGFLIWIIGMTAILINGFFVRRDIAAKQLMRGLFYAIFGSFGILALLVAALDISTRPDVILNYGSRIATLFSSSGYLMALAVFGLLGTAGFIVGQRINRGSE